MITLSEKLKSETLSLHKSIEKVQALSQLMSPSLTIEGYHRLIQSWFSFIQPIETELKKINELHLLFDDMEQRYKTSKLTRDLITLEVEAPNPSSKSIPQCNNIEQALGILYVIEGSTLGGQMISKMLLKHDFINENCISYYNSYGEQTRTYWSTFKNTIDKWGELNPEKHSIVIESAKICFEKLAQHFRKN